MEMDLRTPVERQRDERHEEIRQTYLMLSSEHPDLAANRIFCAIANKYSMTSMGVRRIVERAGLYQSRR